MNDVEMKDSGIDWIEQVPSDWEVKNFTHEFTFFKGLSITKEDLVEEGLAVVSYGQIHSEKNVSTTLLPELLRFIPSEIAERNPGARLHLGDIVFADTSEDQDGCGNCVLMDLDRIVYAGYHDIVARPRRPDFAKYYAYLFNSDYWRTQIRSKVAGIKVFSMTQKIFKGVHVVIPPLPAQRAIAAYLDEKTAAIEAKVKVLGEMLEKYRKLKTAIINRCVTRGVTNVELKIENVKLKDSGVDWIGPVPEGWKIRNLTHEFSFFKGLSITKEDLVEDGVSVVSYGQIHSDENRGTTMAPGLLRFVSRETADMNPNARLRNGDIVFADTSEDIEGCGNFVLMDLATEVFAGYHTIVARPCDPASARFFAYLFNSSIWRRQIRSKVVGIKVYSMTQKVFKGVGVLIPPLAEQREIAAYLDEKCAKIDEAAAIVEKQIDAYKRLKRSLINEVVTGKRRVA